MVLFEIFGSKKFDPNIHQSAPNCTILKKFLGWGKTPNPPNKEHGFATCRFPNLKKLLAPPPKPGDAPVHPQISITPISVL